MFFKTNNLFKAAIFIVVMGLFFFATFPVSAQVKGLTNRPVADIIASAIDWLLGIAASLTILFLIIGGIYYMTAAGDDQQMTTAKTMITYAIVGLIFIIISYSIVVTVNGIINP